MLGRRNSRNPKVEDQFSLQEGRAIRSLRDYTNMRVFLREALVCVNCLTMGGNEQRLLYALLIPYLRLHANSFKARITGGKTGYTISVLCTSTSTVYSTEIKKYKV